uniref:PHD finger protein rhinoceros n=3 Tax=Cacopsylla melanoneura TaxID=428564 RepID=A0A8D8ZIB2_9HEMI
MYNHTPNSSSTASPAKSLGKKSPAKPTRVSARVQSQHKSPGPGSTPDPNLPPPPIQTKSRLRDVKKTKVKPNAKKAKNKKKLYEYNDNTIHSKLVGTVYDFDFDDEFDDEGASGGVENLRAMRERRRSTDHDKVKSSPARSATKVKITLKPRPTPSPSPSTPSPSPSPEHQIEQLVAPIMPGPVDMRTYNSYPSSSNYDSMLGVPLSSAATEEVSDLVEDLEKELESLTNEKKKQSPAVTVNQMLDSTIEGVVSREQSPPPQNKILLSDSRNQLKVKIKGPFLDANYPLNTTPQQPIVVPSIQANLSGTSNLRRMRKKELLHQYCSQDMNMDETLPINTPVTSAPIISIPKAVTSISTIPTKEDYKPVVDANIEKKKKKERVDLAEEEEENYSVDLKRKLKLPPACPTPKLKIKIGGQDGNSISVEDSSKNLRIRPPKKRITNPAPSHNNYEELKRENMKYRKKVMADFSEKDKPVTKKKKRSSAHVELINDDHRAPPKIIIRFGPRDSSSRETTNISIHSSSESIKSAPKPSSVSELRKVRTAKTTPIRLKLTRCEEGYAMKTEPPCTPDKSDCQVR